MSEIRISDTRQDLASLLAGLAPGEEVAIVEHGKRVAVLRKEQEQDFGCKAGSASGKIFFMAADFDSPLDDFAEYMR